MSEKKQLKNKKNKDTLRFVRFLKDNYLWMLLGAIFILHLFFRFYQLQERASWGWDQVDVAWNEKKILIDHDYPILGMPAKGDTGIRMGPAYYYLATPFYFLTNLHPIASPLFASIVSIFTFFVLFFVTKKLFSFPIALITTAIDTFSIYAIHFDRIQWPVNFIIPISCLIFFSLYKIITGSPKYFFLLAIALGFSFQIHFTSLFYLVIIMCCLPLFPRKKTTLLFALYSLPLFIIWFIPFFLLPHGGNTLGGTIITYLQENFLGVHLRRILQVMHDGFIEFQGVLFFPFFQYISFLFLPIFLFVYLYKKVTREKLVLCYLAVLWFVVPWFAFSTYSGEISNYYFSMTRPLALMILAYLSYRAYEYKWYIGGIIAVFWVLFAFSNIQEFFKKPDNEFAFRKHLALEKMRRGEPIELHKNVPEAYWHWYLKDYKKISL